MTTTTVEALLAHAPLVRRLARQLARDPEAAEELEQETWAQAMHAPARVENPAAWLAAVVRNVARTQGRAGRRRRYHEQHAARAEAAAHTSAERAEGLRALAQGLVDLPEELRQVLVMRFFDELPPRTIARRLGVPLETVKTRLQRGKRRLRGKLDQHFGSRAAWVSLWVPARGVGVPAALALVLVAALTGAGVWWASSSSPWGGERMPLESARPGVAASTSGVETPGPAAVDVERAPAGGADAAGAATAPRAGRVRSLMVVVVDEGGQPVEGLPVVLDSRVWSDIDEGAPVTDALGRVSLEVDSWDATEDRLWVTLGILSDDPVTHTVLSDEWPTAPITLVAPPFGAVEVRAPDAPRRGTLEIRSSNDWNLHPRNGGWPWVAVGTTIEIEYEPLRFIDELREGGVVRRIDDLAAGETRVVTIDPASEDVGFVLRLLSEDAPIARKRVGIGLEYEYHDGRRGTLRSVARTTDEGTVLLSLGSAMLAERRPLAALVQWGTEVVRVPLPASPPIGRHELGPLELGPAPQPTTGIVLDRTGAPVPGATVELETWDEDTEDWDHTSVDGATDSEGAFALAAYPYPFDGERARVCVGAEGFQEVFVEVALGGEARVTLESLGSLRLDIRSARRFSAGALSMVNVAIGPNAMSRPYRGDLVGGAIEGLAPGTYSFHVGSHVGAGGSLVVEDVVIAHGVNRDARIDAIELGDVLDAWTVRVSGATGPVSRCRVRFFVRSDEWGLVYDGQVEGDGGEVQALVAPGTVRDLVVSARGFAPLLLRDVDGDRDVVLEPLLARVFEWDGPATTARLRSVEEWRRFDREVVLAAGRSQELSFPGPGAYRLSFEDARFGGPELSPGAPAQSQVLFAVGDEETVRLAPPPLVTLARGRVLSAGGEAVAAEVSLTGGAAELWRTRCRWEGDRFTLVGLPALSENTPLDADWTAGLSLRVVAPGCEPWIRELEIGEVVDVTLEPGR